MSWMHWLLLSLIAIFVILLPISRSRAWGFVRLATVTLVAAVIVMPFIWLICSTFKDPEVMNEYTLLPPPSKISGETVNLKNFNALLREQDTVQGPVSFWRYVNNSLFLASATTFLSMVFSSMGGYALAKYRFPGRNAVLTFMLASLTIPGVVLLAPNFEVIWRLGIMDTHLALVIPAAVSVFGIFLFRQAILGVPDDLLEAARIDGCGEFGIYVSVIMPLVRPMTGAFCLITFLGIWNSFLAPSTYLQTQGNLTLPVVLNQYVGIYRQQYGVFLAGTLLAIVPPAILFFALQREFISGLTSGAVKQ